MSSHHTGAFAPPELSWSQRLVLLRRSARPALFGLAEGMLQGFLRVFVYSSVWVAAGLASLALFTDHALGLGAGWQPVWLIFVSGLFVYNLDHVADARVQEIPDRDAQRYFRHPLVGLLLVASAVLTGLAVAQAPVAARWVFGGYASVGLLYGLPIFPLPRAGGGIRWARLKELPWVKGFMVGATITLAGVGMPLAWTGTAFGLDALAVAIFMFVYVSSACQMFDVRDLTSDASCGMRTLPLAIGVRRTKNALILLNLVLLALMMWGWADGITVPHPEMIAATAITVLYVLLIDVRSPRVVYGVLVDGCMFLPAILVQAHALSG